MRATLCERALTRDILPPVAQQCWHVIQSDSLVLFCVGCVACRGVRYDQISRGHVVHACARVEPCGRTLQLLVSCSRHACRTIPCVCDASHQRLQDRTWRAAQSHWNKVSRVLSGNGVHINRSTFVRIGSAPVSFGGALEVHTGNVLSRTDTEQNGPRAPVALRSFPAMSVTEARSWCSGRVRLFKFVWQGFALHSSPGGCLNRRLLYQRGDAQTKRRHFVHVAAWVSATPPACSAPALRDLIRKRATGVCRRSVCPSCDEQTTHATRWSCAR